jgi:hypothetical protein
VSNEGINFGNKYITLTENPDGISSAELFNTVKLEKGIDGKISGTVEYHGVEISDNSIDVGFSSVSETHKVWEVHRDWTPMYEKVFVPCSIGEFLAGKKTFKYVYNGMAPPGWDHYEQVISVVTFGGMQMQREELYINFVKVSDLYREGYILGVKKDYKIFKLNANDQGFSDWKPVKQ